MTKLFSTASSAAMVTMLSAQAFAQAPAETDEIVVTGYQLQARESIAAKRNEYRVADFLTQDELGRQPDLNVADSLRRLPGVVTIFDEDEGRFVGLRGLDQRYTFISIDGGLIASTDRSDRDINIESIPPTAVKRLEVFKSVTPDLDGQSVGGVINLVTRSAFDADGLYAVVNAQVGIHESIGDLPNSFSNPSPRVDFAVSDTFADDTLGFLVSGTFFDKKRDQGRPIIDYGSNDVGPFISRVLPLDYANEITRWNLLGKLEYRPSDRFYASFTASHFDYQYSEVRYRFELREDASTFDTAGQTATTGGYAEGGALARFDRFPLGQTIDNYQARVEFQPDDRSSFEAGASYSKGVQSHPEPNATWQRGSDAALGFTWDLSTDSADDDRLTTVTLNDPSALLDLSAYQFVNYNDGFFRNEEDVTEWFADYSWNTEGADAGLGFKAGFKYRNLEKNRTQRQERYTLADADAVLTLENFVDPNQTAPYTEDYLPGLNYPVINPDLWDAFFEGNRSLFNVADTSNPNQFYDIQEDVTAAYLMGTYNAGRHALRGGFRFEHTEVATVATLNSGEGQISREISYSDFLPSFLYTYDVRDNVKFRAGYAQALGRPNHPELAGAETFDEANLTIRRANPDLEPRESHSFDVAVDWFMDSGEFFSIAGFYKIIDNQISTITSDEVIGGQLFTVTQPVNLDEVRVSGLEISYTDDSFEFLPAPFDGLGVIANVTLMNGEEGPAPGGNLIAQPDFLINVAGLYNYGPFSGKLTYNVVDDRPTSGTRAENLYEQLDLQLRYQVLDNIQAQFEARNLLNNPRKNFFTDTGLLREINDFGNSYWFGVSYKF